MIDLIRGQNVSRALSILKFTEKRAADPIAQCLNSAIANATYAAEQKNIAIDPDDLWVKTCFVDMGPTKGRKRMRPAPQGRAYREQRHYCHITIQVTSEDKPKTEKELLAEAAKERAANRPKREKKEAPKAAAAKVEAPVVEETVVETAPVEETVVETAAVEETVETTTEEVVAASEETVEAATEEVAATEETVEAATDEVEEVAAAEEEMVAEGAPVEEVASEETPADDAEGEEDTKA